MAGTVLSASAFAQHFGSSDPPQSVSSDRFGHPPVSRYPDPLCEDGQCDINFGNSRNSCDDGTCEIGLRHEDHGSNSFPYVSERQAAAGRIRELSERLKPEYQTSPRNSNETRRPAVQTISWNTDIRRAANLASRENRLILIQISAPWCSHCERMKNETYTDPNLIHLIGRRFVAIEVNADDQKDFVEQMGIRSLPTTLIVAPDLRILNRSQGFQTSEQLMQTLSR